MDKFSNADISYLKASLALAKKAGALAFPNPMVGAVIVKRGKIIGRGYFKKFGSPHAEVEALRAAKTSVAGATLYVNLEPHCFYGKTPPCTEAIIKARISRVVCCTKDPNPKVSGNGIKILKQAGIDVSVGALSKEAEKLNEAFFTSQKKHRPFVAIKFASSLDGKIATSTGDSKWITNQQARNFARNIRNEYQAILVGINTVISDDPNLGSGIKGGHDPIRIILDSKLRVPLKSQVLRDNNVLIVTTKMADKIKYKRLINRGIGIFVCAGKNISLSLLIKELSRRGIISIFVEGGGEVLGSFVDSNLVDKAYIFQAPIIIGGKTAISAVAGKGAAKISRALRLKNITKKSFGDNTLTIGYIANNI